MVLKITNSDINESIEIGLYMVILSSGKTSMNFCTLKDNLSFRQGSHKSMYVFELSCAGTAICFGEGSIEIQFPYNIHISDMCSFLKRIFSCQ